MTRIDKRPEETNAEFVRRYADAIPAEEIVQALVAYLDKRHGRKPSRFSEAWSFIGQITSHGCGVSSAIAAKYRRRDIDTE